MLTVKKKFTSCFIKKITPIQECETSTLTNEFEYLYKNDDEVKCDKITDEIKGIVEYGNDFLNCKAFHSKQQSFLQRIVNLTSNVSSSLLFINIQYYLKLQIPIMHRQFVKLNSQYPENG